jgi:phosphoribosylamine--glycine ligase
MAGKKILLIGSGGREHALAWKIARSPLCEELYVAPGNAGTVKWNIPVKSNDIQGLVRFAKEKQIDLTGSRAGRAA